MNITTVIPAFLQRQQKDLGTPYSVYSPTKGKVTQEEGRVMSGLGYLPLGGQQPAI